MTRNSVLQRGPKRRELAMCSALNAVVLICGVGAKNDIATVAMNLDTWLATADSQKTTMGSRVHRRAPIKGREGAA